MPATILRHVRRVALGVVGLLALLLVAVLIPSSLKTDSRQAVVTAEVVPVVAVSDGPVTADAGPTDRHTSVSAEPDTVELERQRVRRQLAQVRAAHDALAAERNLDAAAAAAQQHTQLQLVLQQMEGARDELARLEQQLAAHVVRTDEVDGVRTRLFALRQDSARLAVPSRQASSVGADLVYLQQRADLESRLERLGARAQRGARHASVRQGGELLILRPRVPVGTWVRAGERIADAVRCDETQIAAVFPAHSHAELPAGRPVRILREADGRSFTGRIIRLEAPSVRHTTDDIWATRLPTARPDDVYAFISIDQETARQPSLVERTLSWLPLFPQRLAARGPVVPDPMAFCGIGVTVRVELE